MPESPEALGRRLVAEMDQDTWTDDEWDESATNLLRFGADDLTDDTLWRAFLVALEAAESDGDLWAIADGFLAESVLVRDALSERFDALIESGHQRAVALVEVMASDRLNWSGPESVAAWAEALHRAPGRPGEPA